MYRILFIIQAAFSLWMLVDAAKKDRFFPWFIIILLPFGEVAYYVAVKYPEEKRARIRRERQNRWKNAC